MVGRVLVTGARGFIGRALLPKLLEHHDRVCAVTRNTDRSALQPSTGPIQWLLSAADFTDLAPAWPDDIAGVIHLAARVHHMGETQSDALARYRASNRDATLALARLARDRGASRFVFVSSIKALGEIEPGRPFREDDEAHPSDPYGISKLEAEQGLRDLETEAFRVTTVRFPLVYGAGVRANFLQLARAVERGTPLPLGRALAPRSLLGVDNAVDALITCLDHPHALGQTFHVADAETPTVRALVIGLARAYGRSARLIDVPVPLLRALARLIGRSDSVDRLVDPLRLDIGRIRSALAWTPHVSLDDGLKRFASSTRAS